MNTQEIRESFITAFHSAGFSPELTEIATHCLDLAVETTVNELFGKGSLKAIRDKHDNDKETSFRKFSNSKSKSPNSRRSDHQAYKAAAAKVQRATALLKKMGEETDALASVRGNSMAGYHATSDDASPTWPEQLEAMLDDLLNKLEAIQAEIELSNDGLSKNQIRRYVDASRVVKKPSAKATLNTRMRGESLNLGEAIDLLGRTHVRRRQDQETRKAVLKNMAANYISRTAKR